MSRFLRRPATGIAFAALASWSCTPGVPAFKLQKIPTSDAVGLYSKACDGGDASACATLGVMYAEGQGVAEDEERAAALYQKACDRGAAGGCSGLAYMYENGL